MTALESVAHTMADTSTLQKYIRCLVPLLLDDGGGDAGSTLESVLDEKASVEQLRRFISEPQVSTLLLERSSGKGKFSPQKQLLRPRVD